MALFTGTYVRTIDAKHRVSLPQQFRYDLTEGGSEPFYVVLAPEGQLWLLERSHFERLAEESAARPLPADDRQGVRSIN